MKFTEEQYQKIVDAWDSRIVYTSKTQSVIEELKAGYLGMVDKALALANPLTREWAHDKFVEKEKKYVWTIKKTDSSGYCISPNKDSDGLIRTIVETRNDKTLATASNSLTESEIKAWGYNPDMFDREEAQ